MSFIQNPGALTFPATLDPAPEVPMASSFVPPHALLSSAELLDEHSTAAESQATLPAEISDPTFSESNLSDVTFEDISFTNSAFPSGELTINSFEPLALIPLTLKPPASDLASKVSARAAQITNTPSRRAADRAARNREGSRRAREKVKARSRAREDALVTALNINRRQSDILDGMTAEVKRLHDFLALCLCRQERY